MPHISLPWHSFIFTVLSRYLTKARVTDRAIKTWFDIFVYLLLLFIVIVYSSHFWMFLFHFWLANTTVSRWRTMFFNDNVSNSDQRTDYGLVTVTEMIQLWTRRFIARIGWTDNHGKQNHGIAVWKACTLFHQSFPRKHHIGQLERSLLS